MTKANFEQAEKNRAVIQTNLDVLERQLNTHATTPMEESLVDRYLTMAGLAESTVMDNFTILQLNVTSGVDMGPHIVIYEDMITRAMRIHAGFHGIKKSFPVQPTAAAAPPSSTTQSIKLPPLELPKFNGNLQEWVSFRDIFTTAVHNSSLTKVEKLTQLRSLLTGEALRQVRSLVLSEANYDIAWKSLQDRYENNRELLFSIMRRLFNQPQLTCNSATNLRTLIDTTKECVRSLEVLTMPTQHWDAVLIFTLFNKIDSTTRELWEQSLPDTNVPTLSKFYDFLEQRARALAASTTQRQPTKSQVQDMKVRAHHAHTSASFNCKLGCNSPHPIFRCPVFQKQTPYQRQEVVKKNSLCFNCLASGHSSNQCTNKHLCKVCNKKHHSMIHVAPEAAASSSPIADVFTNVSSHHAYPPMDLQAGILATARVRVVTGNGTEDLNRSMVDNGSTNTYITERAARRMNLPLRKCNIPMSGLQEASVGNSKYITSFSFKPHFDAMTTFTATALVVKSITKCLPSEQLNRSEWSHLHKLQLADPVYYQPGNIDILLGTDIFWSILENEKVEGKPGQPIAFKSALGWLVGGPNSTSSPVVSFVTNVDLDQQLCRFWESETIPVQPTFNNAEKECEAFFASNHKRDASGRFTVSIPWKSPQKKLGSSRQSAVKRFLSLERKYNSPKTIKDIGKLKILQQHWEDYKAFLSEYEILGHMTLVPSDEVANPKNPTYYIPHHFVLKESSTTTKLRVVFDASAATSNGTSLNDCMMVGPQLQDSLFEIMLRFRIHPIAFTADLEKMYRQIRVDDTDTDLQRILWRNNPAEPIKEYRLNTVTYGTASAPYLAVKCLQQLAQDEKYRFPEASRIALNDFYIDDVASGSSTSTSAKQIVQQLINLCMSGGFTLRKWTTNNAELLYFIPEELRETKTLVELQHDSTTVKTLGIHWNPSEDKYHFKITMPPDMPGSYTKRIIISEVAKIYDPCGWLSPAIIVCKCFIQSLWKVKADWDEVLPEEIQQEWINIRRSLRHLESIYIPRCVMPLPPLRSFLIGCSDASEKAISAVCYILCEYDNSPSTCHLLTAKTKVAPLRPVSIARLELSGAVLLSELMMTVSEALSTSFAAVEAYSDSTITLHWIKSDACRWKTYVRNRVQAVQDNLPSAKWSHIPGEVNPADCASRGIQSINLLEYNLWWNGSQMWYDRPSTEPELLEDESSQMMQECQPAKTFSVSLRPFPQFLNKYSSFRKLQRIVAYWMRFCHNAFAKKRGYQPNGGVLSPEELQISHHAIIKQVQRHCFVTECNALLNNKELPNSSNILPLSPFISEDGILRVGGRLKKAEIPFGVKHPILLPRNHQITTAIIWDTHVRQLHAGPSSVIATLQQQYWIVNARDAVRRVLKKCTRCHRHRADLMKQVMGDLPYHRVNPSRAFKRCGVDYAGPISIRPMVRSKVSLKCWLAIFVCFSTRAIHIEVVSSLTTDCFIAALKRFVSRRGRPSDIFSDCGTNFKGADKVLREFLSLSVDPAVKEECSSQNITWHFNPAGAPHFGGLWEAGVRSIKHHLTRVMGSRLLTYEEMLTLVCQIEGILNSRPLVPASTNPSDLEALTPAHFLVGEPLTAIPEPNVTDLKEGHLDRWQLLQQRQQLFWRRWSQEFITRLQQRPKWCQVLPELKIGNMVIVKDERMPPLKWKLGRVIDVHPGKDGHVRVATVKTADSEIIRPIVKLSLLPITDNE